MDGSAKTPDIQKKKKMKKRLSMWESFFSKVENEFKNSTANGSGSDAEVDLSHFQDPQMLSVDNEHNNLRRSLRIEHGINEESEISESEAEWQLCENGTDNENLSEANSQSEAEANSCLGNAKSEDKTAKKHTSSRKKGVVIPIKSDVQRKQAIKTSTAKENAVKNVRSVHNNNSTINLKRTHNDTLIGKKKHNTNLEGDTITELGRPQEFCPQESSTPIHKSQEKRQPRAQQLTNSIKNNEIKRPTEKEIFKMPVEISRKTVQMEISKGTSHSMICRNSDELLSSKNNITSGQAGNGCSRSNEQQTSSQTPQNLADPSMSTNERDKKLMLKEMCKQYDLWKLYKRRKSGHLGSVHIVSNLNEELTDENRFVPDLPPKVKNPFKIPRRFSLAKPIF